MITVLESSTAATASTARSIAPAMRVASGAGGVEQ